VEVEDAAAEPVAGDAATTRRVPTDSIRTTMRLSLRSAAAGVRRRRTADS